MVWLNITVGGPRNHDMTVFQEESDSIKLFEWIERLNGQDGAESTENPIERDFLLLLHRLQPGRSVVSSFPTIAAKVLAQKQADAEVKKDRGRILYVAEIT